MATLKNDRVLRLDCKPTGQVLCLMFCVAPITFLELNKRSTVMVLWLSKYKKASTKHFSIFIPILVGLLLQNCLTRGKDDCISNQKRYVIERKSLRPIFCSSSTAHGSNGCIYSGLTSSWVSNPTIASSQDIWCPVSRVLKFQKTLSLTWEGFPSQAHSC